MKNRGREKIIFLLQLVPLILVWSIALGFTVFIIYIINLSSELKDVTSVAVGVSLVAIPLLLTMASVLTYVFVGLKRGRKKEETRDIDI
jgi:hypothetical protein